MSARDVDHAEMLFGRVRGALERAEWGTKAERTNVAWEILDQILTTPTDAPRLAFARALVAAAGYAVVPVAQLEEIADSLATCVVDKDLSPDEIRRELEPVERLRAMLAAGQEPTP